MKTDIEEVMAEVLSLRENVKTLQDAVIFLLKERGQSIEEEKDKMRLTWDYLKSELDSLRQAK